ncbi:hypothetical protein FQZ97_708660 [compost metagenome]
MVKVGGLDQLLLLDVVLGQAVEHAEHLVRVLRRAQAGEVQLGQRREVLHGGLAGLQVDADVAIDEVGGGQVLLLVLELRRGVEHRELVVRGLVRPEVEHVRRAVVRPLPVAAGHRHLVLAGLHIHLVDVRSGDVEAAVIRRAHQVDLARHREAAHRLGVEAGAGVVDLQARLLDHVVVVEHLGGVDRGVELLAIGAQGEGEHRTHLLSGLVRQLGVEHRLAVVQVDAVEVAEVVVEDEGGLVVRRHHGRAGAEGVGQAAGLVDAVAGQIDHVQVVRVVGGDHVFMTGLQRRAGFVRGPGIGAECEAGDGGRQAGDGFEFHAVIPLVLIAGHLSFGNTVPRLRQSSWELVAWAFQSW